MPKAVEAMLEAEATKRGLKGKRRDAFVYGVMRHKFGWKPKREK